MPTLDEVYAKFGEVSEAAQLLETDLGSSLLFLGAVDEGLISPELKVDGKRATDLMHRIDRQTLGQLIRNNRRLSDAFEPIEGLLANALDERNRLSHSFYRQHNLRRNSEGGRAIMMADLKAMHEIIIAAWKAVALLGGTDLDALVEQMNKSREGTSSDTVVDPDRVDHLPI